MTQPHGAGTERRTSLTQLVAGYSKNTPLGGLRTCMPDCNDVTATTDLRPGQIHPFRLNHTSMPSPTPPQTAQNPAYPQRQSSSGK